jgi:uncharacterized membrane protein YcfT
MSDNRSSPSAHKSNGKIRPLWRWCIGVASIAGLVLVSMSYKMNQAINAFYHSSIPLVGTKEIVVFFLSSYFFLVAVFGRWWPRPNI